MFSLMNRQFYSRVFTLLVLIFCQPYSVQALNLSYKSEKRDGFIVQLCTGVDWGDMILRLRSEDRQVRADAVEQWIVVGSVKHGSPGALLVSDAVIELIKSGRYPFRWMESRGRYSREILNVLGMNGKVQGLNEALGFSRIIALEGSALFFDFHQRLSRIFYHSPALPNYSNISCF